MVMLTCFRFMTVCCFHVNLMCIMLEDCKEQLQRVQGNARKISAIINFSTMCKEVVSFTLRLIYPRGHDLEEVFRP
jgi:hypothetical protein